MIAAVILAAGASTRLGEPKQLIMMGDETLLERAVRLADDAGCAPIVVVLGASSNRIMERCDIRPARVLVNSLWAEGMASSVRVGVSAAGEADGVILIACDQPAVSASHLRALMVSGDTTASAYAGRRGIPAYFPAASFAGLLLLRGDTGARDLLRHAHAIDLPGGELDIDTPEDVANMRALLG